MTDHSASDLAHTLQKQGKQASLIHVLEEVQSQFRYLPQEAMVLVSERLGVPLSQVYSVATFYHAFSLQPRGLHSLLVCTGTACHVRGAQQILDRLQTQLSIEPGGTTQDGLLTMETGNCLGACALGPVVVLDDQYEGQMSAMKADRLLKGLKRNAEQERD
jgi:NADH-quinone oxidoreductase subunit E